MANARKAKSGRPSPALRSSNYPLLLYWCPVTWLWWRLIIGWNTALVISSPQPFVRSLSFRSETDVPACSTLLTNERTVLKIITFPGLIICDPTFRRSIFFQTASYGCIRLVPFPISRILFYFTRIFFISLACPTNCGNSSWLPANTPRALPNDGLN